MVLKMLFIFFVVMFSAGFFSVYVLRHDKEMVPGGLVTVTFRKFKARLVAFVGEEQSLKELHRNKHKGRHLR